MNGQERWAIINEEGESALTFTSFIDLDVRNEGQALSHPIEEGGFANYNKVRSPLDIRVTVAAQGDEAEFRQILDALDEYQSGAIKLFVSTPSAYYGPVTLQSYMSRRTRESGAGQLTVELIFVEVREVKTRVTTITKPRNPSSADRVDTGKTQAQPYSSILSGGRRN